MFRNFCFAVRTIIKTKFISKSFVIGVNCRASVFVVDGRNLGGIIIPWVESSVIVDI